MEYKRILQLYSALVTLSLLYLGLVYTDVLGYRRGLAFSFFYVLASMFVYFGVPILLITMGVELRKKQPKAVWVIVAGGALLVLSLITLFGSKIIRF